MSVLWMHSEPDESCRAAARSTGRMAFSLVELLVAISIIAVLVALMSAAISGARASTKKQATRLIIEKLDAVVQQQMTTYIARTAPLPGRMPPGFTKGIYRSWYIRRNLITADLPDRWSDVALIASGTLTESGSGSLPLPLTTPQRTYQAIWNGLSESQATVAGKTYAGAECLFMIVMQGGIADCLDCGELKTVDRGDRDQDGLFEFWDAWGNPIGFILWPANLQLPVGTGAKFFSGARELEPAFQGFPTPTLGLRPLIYSAGPDGEYGFDRGGEKANLTLGDDPVLGYGRDCGNWASAPTNGFAGPMAGAPDYRADNLTNLDTEAAP